MNRALRLWSAVSWWLVPLAILAMGAVDLAQNGSLSSNAGGSVTFPGPVAANAVFLLLVTVPLCWRFRAPTTIAIVVTVATAAWDLVLFSAKAQPPIEPYLAILVAVFALASRVDGRRLLIAASISGGLVLAGEVRGELAGQGTGNVLPAVLGYILIFALGRMVHAHKRHALGQQDRAERLERDRDVLATQAVAAERGTTGVGDADTSDCCEKASAKPRDQPG